MDGDGGQSLYRGEQRNTDRVLHENADCRILWTEQHKLGIDVGGSVSVRDPSDWHMAVRRVSELERVIVNARREFRNGGDPVDARAWLFRVTIDEDQYPHDSTR